jgi:hypothetical protein
MGRRLAGSITVLATIAAFGALFFAAQASAASGYYVTFAARKCPSYDDIYANKARNDIVESLRDLGPNTQYGNSGALISPAYEDLAPQTSCSPLPNWRFTLGTGYVTRAVTGVWGSMSKVTGAYATSIVTQASTPLLDNHGDPIGSQTIAGAVTIKLTDAQAARASKSSSLWAQGGVPDDPVLAGQFGTPQAPDYGFGTLRCATDNVNGDNVEYIFFPSGTNHVFCYGYYVTPPPTSGTIIIRKRVVGAPAGTDPSFSFSGDLSFDPTGFTLKNGQSSTFYRAGGQTWSVTEGGVSNYRLDSVSCTATASGGAPTTSTTSTTGSTLSVNLTAGETVDCTFTNSWVPPTGSLTIQKITEGGIGTFRYLVTPSAGGAATSVTATTSRIGVPATAIPDDSLANLTPGTYTISEDQPDSTLGAWELVGSDCNGVSRSTREVSVTITAGSRTVCTFTNRLVGGGSISLSKVTEGDTGTAAFVIQPAEREDVQYQQRATTHESGVAADAVPDNPSDATDHLDLGSYWLIEQSPLQAPPGDSWTLSSVQCDGVDVPFSDGAVELALDRGHPSAACRFTDTLIHALPVDPEPKEPEAPTPPTTEPDGSSKPEGTRPEPASVWADLSISTTPAPRQVQSGHRLTDTVVITNRGPSDAEGVTLDYSTATPATLVGIRTPQGSCSRSLPATCELGTLKSGQRLVLTVVMVPAKASGDFRMHAVLGSSTYDPDASNDVSDEVAYIPPLPPPIPIGPVACPSRGGPVAHPAC